METARTIRWVAIVTGLLFAGLTLGLEKIPEHLVVLLIPGLIGSMAVSGNVHAFPLWPAAIVNGVVYFGLGWAGAAVVRKAARSREH